MRVEDDVEVLAAFERRVAEHGWAWRDEATGRVWTARIIRRMVIASLDPDEAAGAVAARAAFVDGLEDAAAIGALVARAPEPSTWWRRVRRLRDAMG